MKYFPRVRSKNHSLNALRRANKGLPALPVKSVVRFGSTTPTVKVFTKATNVPIVEINTVDAVKKSSSKLLMKRAFDTADVPHAEWYTFPSTLSDYVEDPEGNQIKYNKLHYPIVLKRIFGFGGHGMQLLENHEQLAAAAQRISPKEYYIEQYKNYTKEYRLHCTADGCFYTNRKMLKKDTENRWYRNNSNSVWYLETNPDFDKPGNWDEIVSACVTALHEVGLDFGAFDVRVQSSKSGKVTNPKFVIIEVNSAPAFGEGTEEKYKSILPQLIMKKAKENA